MGIKIEKLSKDIWRGKKYHYTQVEDLDGRYIYKADIHYKDGMKDTSYEVFKKRVVPKNEFKDGHWQKVDDVMTEVYPSTEHWGIYAWTCMAIKRCHEVIKAKTCPN